MYNIDTLKDPGVPPSSFLSCLRDGGVKLSVSEEATLLDCLDLEHLAYTHTANKLSKGGRSGKRTLRA